MLADRSVSSRQRSSGRRTPSPPPYPDPVSLADEILPDRGRPDLVQTEWASGWGYESSGFTEAARFLTEHRAQFHANIDQVGLVVFYLQRHRVELALKELLLAHRVELSEIKSPHSLDALWQECKQKIGPDPEAWAYLDSEAGELIALLHEIDPDSHAFRYPVDRSGNTHDRPKYIDLTALEKHVDALCGAIDGCITYLAEAREHETEMNRELEQDMRQELMDG